MKFLQKNWIIAAVIVVLVIVAGYFVSVNVQESGEVATGATIQKERIKVSVVVNPGSAKTLSAQEIEVEKGKSALDATREVAELETKGEGEMAFVISIGGRKADPANNEFWELVINGESSQVGAGSYVVKNGDRIEWRVSKF